MFIGPSTVKGRQLLRTHIPGRESWGTLLEFCIPQMSICYLRAKHQIHSKILRSGIQRRYLSLRYTLCIMLVIYYTLFLSRLLLLLFCSVPQGTDTYRTYHLGFFTLLRLQAFFSYRKAEAFGLPETWTWLLYQLPASTAKASFGASFIQLPKGLMPLLY